MTAFVLDTSAILTVLNQEDGTETVTSLLNEASKGQVTIYLPFMALMELEYLLLRSISADETRYLLALVKSWAVQVVESDEEWRHQAAAIKARTPLSVADAWNASLALQQGAQLIHKDPEYENVAHLSALPLPYKV